MPLAVERPLCLLSDTVRRQPSLFAPFKSRSLDMYLIQDPMADKDPKYQDFFTNPALPYRGGSISPTIRLEPLPTYRCPSTGVSEVSELFKTASIEDDDSTSPRDISYNLTASTNTSAPPPIPSCSERSLDLFGSASRPIHLRHLSSPHNISLLEIAPFFSIIPPLPSHYNLSGRVHSSRFPPDHQLNAHFVENYQLEDELGSGGYGFVMTARHRLDGQEVAVKFIIKEKVPDYAWMEDELLGRLPTEVVLLNAIQHDNIVKFVDFFEDEHYFYLIEELHGTPWLSSEHDTQQAGSISIPSTPALSPSSSEKSLDSNEPCITPSSTPLPCINTNVAQSPASPHYSHLSVPPETANKSERSRRPSHDLFECLEQSEHKRFSEPQARYIFAQVVDTVQYLDERGIAHRDIKDENIVIDRNLKVKLIDFGSAIAVDPKKPRPYYNLFYGTAAYASSEILLKKEYQAAPAEIWTLGVLLSYLLTGTSPFPSVKDAADGKIVMCESAMDVVLSEEAMDLVRRCLDSNPARRITIQQVKEHPWLAPAAISDSAGRGTPA